MPRKIIRFDNYQMNNEIEIDYEEIINEFAKLKSRNLDMFWKCIFKKKMKIS